jgi:hypothetical protein
MNCYDAMLNDIVQLMLHAVVKECASCDENIYTSTLTPKQMLNTNKATMKVPI